MSKLAAMAGALLLALAVGSLGGLLYWIVNLPIVEVTYPGTECVRVWPPEAGDCDNLPDTYEQVFVSEEKRYDD